MGEKASFTGRDGTGNDALKRDESADTADLVEIAHTLRQVVCVKG